jgi:hypothetical protein
MKLPIRQIAHAAYETIGRHGRQFLIIAIPLAIASLALTELISALLVAMIDPGASRALLSTIVSIFIFAVVPAAAEVHWFRILLLGERHEPRAYFRIGRRELRYAVVSIVIGALVAAPFLTAELASTYLTSDGAGDETSPTFAVQVYAAHTSASVIVSTIIAAWLSPLLAAIAVDREDQSLAAVARLTRRNRIQIGIIFLICFEPLKIVIVTTELYWAGSLDGFGFWSVVYVTYVVWTTFCYVAVAAEIYWELERGKAFQTLGAVFD